jgi:heme/copper-type cytochrome/quinol oxidase subunit 3
MLNMASTIGAFIMAISVIVFVVNIVKSLRTGAVAGDNPWDAWTLEWATTSPPHAHNFESVPLIRGRRPLWDLAHPPAAEGTSPESKNVPPPEKDPPDKSLVAVWAFIVSETTFFIALILSYVLFNGSTKDSGVLDIKKTGVFTLCLVASSLTLHVAERSRERGKENAFRMWMIVTIALGVIFMSGQAAEYVGLFDRGISVSSSLFATTFFTLTGFHGLHVTLGLIALGILLALAFKGDGRDKTARALTAVGVYWHFVDVVWIVVFSVVYVRSVL